VTNSYAYFAADNHYDMKHADNVTLGRNYSTTPVTGLSTELKPATIVVVEDDESHRLVLSRALEGEGYSVVSIADGEEAIAYLEENKPDMVLLDVMLPNYSGIDICKYLRQKSIYIPIVMISARSEEIDIVLGIEVGADDYIVKPYRMRELLARVSVLFRRSNRTQSEIKKTSPPEHFEEVLRGGDVILDQSKYEVFYRGERIDLPLREFQLLRELLLVKGRVITRDELLLNIWGFGYEGDPRIVATLISRLRSRIEEDPDNPKHIITIRGVGYRFDE
jgi:DNA-binding response OmpR family regulator